MTQLQMVRSGIHRTEATRLARMILDFEVSAMRDELDEDHDEQFLTDSIGLPETILVIATDAARTDALIGMLLCVPHRVIVDDVRAKDPLMPTSADGWLYVETLGIHPAFRGGPILMRMMSAVTQRAGEIGVRGLMLHARTVNGFSALITRYLDRAPWRLLRTRDVENCDYAHGEPVLYVEAAYDRRSA